MIRLLDINRNNSENPPVSHDTDNTKLQVCNITIPSLSSTNTSPMSSETRNTIIAEYANNVYLLVTAISGLIVHLLILTVTFRNRHKMDQPNWAFAYLSGFYIIFNVSQSISAFLLLVDPVGNALVTDSLYCQTNAWLLLFNAAMILYCTVALTVERYAVIVKGKKLATNRRFACYILFGSIMASLLASGHLFEGRHFQVAPSNTHCMAG